MYPAVEYRQANAIFVMERKTRINNMLVATATESTMAMDMEVLVVLIIYYPANALFDRKIFCANFLVRRKRQTNATKNTNVHKNPIKSV